MRTVDGLDVGGCSLVGSFVVEDDDEEVGRYGVSLS